MLKKRLDCSYRTGTKGFHSTKKDEMIILKRFQAFCQIFTWRKVCIIGCKRLPASEKEWNSLSLKGFDSEWCSAKLEAYKNCKSTKKNYQKCEIKLIETSPEERIDLLLEKFIFSTVKQLDTVNSIYNIHTSPLLYSTSHF